MYTLRDKHGIAKGKVDDVTVYQLLGEDKAAWKNTEKGGRCVFMTSNMTKIIGPITIYFWDDDVLVPDK